MKATGEEKQNTTCYCFCRAEKEKQIPADRLSVWSFNTVCCLYVAAQKNNWVILDVKYQRRLISECAAHALETQATPVPSWAIRTGSPSSPSDRLFNITAEEHRAIRLLPPCPPSLPRTRFSICRIRRSRWCYLQPSSSVLHPALDGDSRLDCRKLQPPSLPPSSSRCFGPGLRLCCQLLSHQVLRGFCRGGNISVAWAPLVCFREQDSQ